MGRTCYIISAFALTVLLADIKIRHVYQPIYVLISENSHHWEQPQILGTCILFNKKINVHDIICKQNASKQCLANQ